MTADERIAALLAESRTLNPGKDAARLCAIYAEAATLVDRKEKPKKWAAFRFFYGQVIDPIDPQAALNAYRDAVSCLDAVTDRETWASCKACIGFGLAALGKGTPPESEEVIECLEAAIADYPNGAPTLATYYEERRIGDRWENWKKRVHFLELALSQVTPEGDPLRWAGLKNAIAVALRSEPDGDFAKAVETSIQFHQQALAVLEALRQQAGSPAQRQWIMINLDASEAYLSRVGTDRRRDIEKAERYARDAYEACGPAVAKDTRALATMGLARVLLNEGGGGSPDRFVEGLALCDQTDSLLDSKVQPAVAATNEKFKALARLRLMELGDVSKLDGLLQAADTAYSLLDPALYSDLRRLVMQIAADGLFVAGDFGRAIDYLGRAVEAGERTLQQATSRAGRLESIFDLHDSYARLGYCLFQKKEIRQGIEVTDRGKGRLWRPARSFATFEQIRTLVPKGGALLFVTFAPKDGMIAVVTEEREQLCSLRGFGRERLTELLSEGLDKPESPSWLSRYIYRNSSPERWLGAIESIGSVLFDVFWSPLIETLAALGVEEGAEVVLFPQAGLGVLPFHAAWKGEGAARQWIGEKYAVRYAPSASCLIDKPVGSKSGGSLLVSDPLGDLANSALEAAWVRETEPPQALTLLTGGEATKQAVTAAVAGAAHAHFSTHAVFHVGDPFQSSIVLANGTMLSLEELLPLLENAKLQTVVLSGCETAMAQVARRPDELLGFPAAFLEHSTATVIATQWPVDDWASAALVGRFYREWKLTGKSPAQALRAAQNWMRAVTVEELSQLLRPLKNDPGPVGDLAAEIRTSLTGMADTDRPFAHPYFWAAFTVSGV